MTDFYTVLQNAIDRVGASSAEDRERVYTHVRDVMLRKLRNHRPPLPEAEIANRLNTFDAAIDRIETELAAPTQRFVESRSAGVSRSGRRAEGRAFDDEEPGYDDEDGFAGDENAERNPEPIWGSPAIEMAWDENAEQWRDPPRSRPAVTPRHLAGESWESPAEFEELESDFAVDELPQEPRPSRPAPDGYGSRSGYDDEGDDRAPIAAPRRHLAGSDRPSLWARLVALFDRGDRTPPEEQRSARGRRRRTTRGDPIDELANRLGSRTPESRKEPLLIAGPARAEPRLFLPSPEAAPSAEASPDRLDPAEAPDEGPLGAVPAPRRWEAETFEEEEPARTRRRRRPKRSAQQRRQRARTARATHVDEDEPETARDLDRRRRIVRIGLLAFAAIVIGWSAYVFIPIIFPAAPDDEAPDTPAVAADAVDAAAGDSFVLFRGEDPTIFESGSDNPVEFVASDDGSYVRIGSTITSGGARAVIGPGLAERLTGREIRVVMEVRGSPEQPAATTRLSYQRGVSIDEWLLRVPTEFGIITASWVVSEAAADGADYLLIEPGVPGDGNSIDIRGIAIEIVSE